MISKNIDDYVVINRGAIPEELRQQVLDKINQTQWEKHRYHNIKGDDLQTLNPDNEELDINYNTAGNVLINLIEKCIFEYMKIVPPAGKYGVISNFTTPRFNRYESGQRMKPHVDHIRTIFDGEKKGIPVYTVLGLLNDEFEGGEFLMWEDEKIDLQAGDILIFPSNFMFPHHVEPVKYGKRYSFVSWVW